MQPVPKEQAGDATGGPSSGPPQLTFAHQGLHAGWEVVTLAGEVDLATAQSLRTELQTALARSSPRLIVDLSDVTFMDSSGLTALIAAHRRAKAIDGKLCLAGANPVVRKVLAVTGLDKVFPVHDSIDDVINANNAVTSPHGPHS